MKKCLILLFLGFMFILSCDDNVSPKEELGKIQIKILDARTYQPVSGVFVRTSPPSQTVIAGENGEYILEDVSPGIYEVFIEKVGYTSNSVSIKVASNKITKAEILFYDLSFNNSPPDKPEILEPYDKSIVYADSVLLKWHCFDEDEDELSYTIYLDNVNPPATILETDLLDTECWVKDLKPNVKYFWRVAVKDKYSLGVVSAVSSFTVDTTEQINIDGLVLDLKFNNSYQDSGPNKLSVMCSSPSYIADRNNVQNNAFMFIKNPVVVGFNPAINLNTNFSVSFWINPNSTYGTDLYDGVAHLIGRYYVSGANTSSYCIGITGASNLCLQSYNHPAGEKMISSLGELPSGTWTHVVCIFTTSSFQVYLNGTSKGTFNIQTPGTSPYDIYIGGRQTNNRYYNGGFDDLKIFNKVLNQSEITALSKM